MERSLSHQIDTQAQKILDSKCPVDWVKREQHPDYGIDYEVQVFDGKNPTDTWFRIQLKGKEKYFETSESIKIQFKTDTLEYYMTKVPFPVFLIVVHVRKQEIHWLFIQKYVNEILKNKNPEWMKQKTVTLTIPKKNVFNDTKKIESIAREGMKYTHQLVFGIPDWSLSFEVEGALDDINKFEENRKRRYKEQNEMDLQLAVKYHEMENKEKSAKMFKDIFKRTKDDEDCRIEHLSSVSGIISLISPLQKSERKIILDNASYALKIAEKIDNKRFIYYFRGIFFESLYYHFNERIFNNTMLQKVTSTQKGLDEGINSLLHLFQSEEYNHLLEISNEYSKNLYESFENGEYIVALDLIIRLIQINLLSYMDSTTRQSKEELHPLLEYVSDLVDNASLLADMLEDNGYKCEVMRHKAMLLFVQNKKEYKDVLKSLKALAVKDNIKHYVTLSEDLLKDFKEQGPYPESPEDWPKAPSIEEIPDDKIDQLHRELAEMANIDLESNDEIAYITNIGLKDRNPERILKNCSNLEVAIGSYGIPGRITGLRTAGSKFLFCKYGTGVYGLELDNLYNIIKEKHCKSCEYHNPMPKDWKWSLTWQQEKDSKRTPEFQNFINNFNKSLKPKID